MARRSLAAKRYAEAVASHASRDDSWDAWLSDLSTVSTAMDDPSVRAVFADPNQRKAVALFLDSRAITDGLRETTVRLLHVMAAKRTIVLLPDVVEWLRDLADEARGVRRISVTSAFPLDAALQQQVREHLAGERADRVVLSLHVEPEILGGLVIREGDQISDRSVRARLESLLERMS